MQVLERRDQRRDARRASDGVDEDLEVQIFELISGLSQIS